MILPRILVQHQCELIPSPDATGSPILITLKLALDPHLGLQLHPRLQHLQLRLRGLFILLLSARSCIDVTETL